MANVCMLTGAKPGFGNTISHSHRRTRQRFNPNIQRKRFWLASENRWVRLTLTTRAIKTVDKRGVDSVVAELRSKGIKL